MILASKSEEKEKGEHMFRVDAYQRRQKKNKKEKGFHKKKESSSGLCTGQTALSQPSNHLRAV